MKNIFNIIEDASLEAGGQRTATVNLHNYINESLQFNSTILTNKKEDSDLFTEILPSKIGLWEYSPKLKKYLIENISNANLVHIHGAWMYTQYISSKISIKNKMPYVITLHGMTTPYYLNQKQFKKKIYVDLILKKILKEANVIHAITRFEKEAIFKLTKHKNIVEIPNFIFSSKIPNLSTYNPNEEYLLFLSRIHPGKGLDILIRAMSKIQDKNIKLKIVGTENAYSEILKKEIATFGLENRVQFLGSVFGNEKFTLFANAKAFVLPSYSEAIGMVNLEAAICNTPVITTFATGLHQDWNLNGGILINPKVEELTTAINNAVAWDERERNDRGIALSEFTTNNYSWEKKGHLWFDLYNQLL